MKTMNTMKSMALVVMMMMTTTMSATTNVKGKNDKAPVTVVVNNQRGHANTSTISVKPTAPATHGAVIVNQRGHQHPQPMRECNCRNCQKTRKALEKHMRNYHTGKQNRMTCRTCMEYSHQLNRHNEMNNHSHSHR